MRTKLVEVTNGPNNWGKFLVGVLDGEWRRWSEVDKGSRLLMACGWRIDNVLVFDLQTKEGAAFRLGGNARADLERHKIWVCPLFEPFLVWLYQQSDPLTIPDHVDLPDAPFAIFGHRRPGPGAP